jgi:phosphoribosyl-AMP cyclohydrolase
MKTHWILQRNIMQKDLEEIIAAIEEQNMTYETFFHIPFSDSYPALPETDNIFVYGASSTTDKIKENYSSFKGVFAHSEELNMKHYYNATPDMMWSKPIFIGKMKEVLTFDEKFDNEQYFIRPAADNKHFAGHVISQKELKTWTEKLMSDVMQINPEEDEVFIAEIKYPQKEYRVCVNNGDVFASSLYRQNMDVQMEEGCTEEIKHFVKDFYSKNNLPQICIVDIAIKDNEIGVIEVNNVNNSGFYSINKKDWVKGISQGIEHLLNKNL